MKVILLALAVFTAGTSATSIRNPQARFVDLIVISAINDVIESIQEAGLDPVNIGSEQYYYRLPVTDLLSADAVLEEFLMEGLSNIVINSINFSLIFTRLDLDIALPAIRVNIGSGKGSVIFANRQASGAISGSLVIENIRVAGRINFSLFGGIGISSMDINFGVARIASDLKVVAFDRDLSVLVNTIFNEIIPEFLEEFSDDINLIVEYIIEIIVENELN